MFEYYNSVLCVSAGWLYGDGQILTKSNYDALVRRGWIKVLRRASYNTPALVAFDTIPERFRSEIIRITGDPHQKASRTTFKDNITPDAAALEFFSAYKLSDGRNLPEATVLEYCNNAAILNTIAKAVNTRISKRRALGGKVADIWETVAAEVEQLKDDMKHSLPSNSRRLKDKFKDYQKEGYTALIHRNFCNDNSRKVSASIESLILSLYASPEKPYSASVHDMYMRFLGGAVDVVDIETGELFDRNDFFDKNGAPVTLSESTIWNYINDPRNRVTVDKVRTGRHEFMTFHRPHHHRKAPVFSLSKISLDDRDLPRKLHDGSYVKAYYAYDVASGVLLGAAYSKFKDKNLFLECLRDMFRTIDKYSLGMPLEVEVEHHLVNKFKDDLMKAGMVFQFVRWCNPGNSQEKRAEHYNRAKKYGYEKKYQDGIGRWYAKLEANRPKQNADWDENGMVIKEKTYSFEDLVADDRRMIEMMNNDLHPKQKLYKGLSRLDVLRKFENPNSARIEKRILARYIGEVTETSIRRSQYVRVQYEDYQLPSPEVLGKLEPNNYTVQAYYFPTDNIESVYVYQNLEYIGEFPKIVKYNEATAEQTDTDREAFTNQSKYVARFDKMVKDGKNDLKKVKTISTDIPTTPDAGSIIIPISPVQEDPLSRPSTEWDSDADYYSSRALDDL